MELREPTVFLVRHGATSFNADNSDESRLKGTRFDLPLTDEGHKEAEQAAQYLKDFDIASIRHSDMLRGNQTASHIEKATGLKSKPDKRFDPWDVGYLSGHTKADARRRLEYYITNAFKAVPEGESYQDWFDKFEAGLLAELKAAEKEHASPFKAHVIVSHSCAMKATDAILKGDEPKVHSEENTESPGNIKKLSKKAGKWRMADVDLSGPGSR